WRHPSEVAATPWPVATQPPRTRRWGREPKLWSVALLAGLIGALLASGVIGTTGTFRRSMTTVVHPMESVMVPAANTLTSFTSDDDAVRIAQMLRPSIVEIEVNGDKGSSSGSGLVFRSDGYIITNNHLIDGAASIEAGLADGRQLKATKVGGDADTDIA